jgi:hypothetical protein
VEVGMSNTHVSFSSCSPPVTMPKPPNTTRLVAVSGEGHGTMVCPLGKVPRHHTTTQLVVGDGGGSVYASVCGGGTRGGRGESGALGGAADRPHGEGEGEGESVPLSKAGQEGVHCQPDGGPHQAGGVKVVKVAQGLVGGALPTKDIEARAHDS